MKEIQLTLGQVALVDDEDFEYLNLWKWTAQWNECVQGYYAVRNEGTKRILMHRIVSKAPKGMLCDHIHHNTLDNRKDELRNVTRSQSQMNRGINKNNKIGIKGVSKRNDRKDYVAQLYFEGRTVLCNYFSTIEEATKARVEAEEKYFGEFRYQE